MIRNFHFHGDLATLYGDKPLRFNADGIPMMFRALQSRHPTFRRDLSQFSQIAFVKQNGERFVPIPEEQLDWAFGNYPDIHIAAGVDGAGVETFAYLGYVGWAAVAAYVAVQIVVMVVMTAITKALADKPKTHEGQQVDRKESNLFNGPANNVNQGHPLQLIYGTFKVGTTRVSSEVVSEKQTIATNDVHQILAGTTDSGNILANDYGVSVSLASFVVNGVTTAAGGTYTNANYSITINADGHFSVSADAEFVGEFYVTCNVIGANGSNGTSILTVQSYIPAVYDGGGGGGDGG